MCSRVDQRSSPRVSIWTVREDVRNLYSWLFTVLMFLGIGYILVSGIAKALEEFWGLLATLSVATATVSIIVTEIGGTVMVLASWALDKRDEWRAKLRQEAEQQGRKAGRAEGREEGREEGRMDAHEAWSAWNARRLAAEQNGGAFTEPPPAIEDRGQSG